MMKFFTMICCLLAVQFLQAQQPVLFTVNKDSTKIQLTLEGARHLAGLPMHCIGQEYPNKTSHTTFSDSDNVLTPAQLHPAFYGCFDWHSCVHGFWMLTRLMKMFPDLPEKKAIQQLFDEHLSPEKIAGEAAYFEMPYTAAWERTYGWAWLLKLDQELMEWDDSHAKKWHAALQPLTKKIIGLWQTFLPKQTYPNRTGVHPNTAFGLVFALDYARAAHHTDLDSAICRVARKLFLNDQKVPASWEPDGTDFLSPALEEIDLMRRVLPGTAFRQWLNAFIPGKGLEHLMNIPVVSDRNDFQIVHLDGLCFSRSWCMSGLARTLPAYDTRKMMLQKAAIRLLNASLPHVASGNYGGEHWLASFAVYALGNEK